MNGKLYKLYAFLRNMLNSDESRHDKMIKKYYRFLKEHNVYSRAMYIHMHCLSKDLGGIIVRSHDIKSVLNPKYVSIWLISPEIFADWNMTKEGPGLWRRIALLWLLKTIDLELMPQPESEQEMMNIASKIDTIFRYCRANAINYSKRDYKEICDEYKSYKKNAVKKYKFPKWIVGL